MHLSAAIILVEAKFINVHNKLYVMCIYFIIYNKISVSFASP